MNKIQSDTICLLRNALTLKKSPLPDKFDYKAIFDIAAKHQVTTLVYYGLTACGVDTQSEFLQPFFNLCCQKIMNSENQMYELKKMYDCFDKNGIDYLILKGAALKQMYPNVNMREMSDADVLIRMNQYEKTSEIMKDLGFKFCLKSDHELIWKKNKLYLELHHCPFSEANKDFYAYFGDGWGRAVKSDGNKYVYSNEDQLVYILTHFAKHYRRAGVGIRGILDIYILLNSKTLDEAYLKKELKKLGLFDFYKNIVKVIDVWFGNGKPDKVTDVITNVVFNSGSFGAHETYVLSDAINDREKTGSVFLSRGKKVVFLFFPPLSKMRERYHKLNKKPLLLPFFWVYRWFSANNKTSIIKKNYSDMQTVKKAKMGEYVDNLKLVGLKFNYRE